MNYPNLEQSPRRAFATNTPKGMLRHAANIGARTGGETTLDNLKAEM